MDLTHFTFYIVYYMFIILVLYSCFFRLLNSGNSANISLLIFQFILWSRHLLPPIGRPFVLFFPLRCTNLFTRQTKKKTGRGTRGFRETGLSVGQVALGWISCQPTVADSMSSSCEPAPPIKPYLCIYPSSTSSPIPAPETPGK